MDLIKIAESASLDMEGLPLCGPGMASNCEDGKCGECPNCFRKEMLVEDDDVEAQTPTAASDGNDIDTNTPGAFSFDTPKAMSAGNDIDTNNLYNLSFDLSPDENVDDEFISKTAAASSPEPQSTSQPEPVYELPTESTPTAKPSSWLGYLSLPSLPIPFTPTPPVELKTLQVKEQQELPVASPVQTQLVSNATENNTSFTRAKSTLQMSKTPPTKSTSHKATLKDTSARTVRAGNIPLSQPNEMSQSQSMLSKPHPIELGVKRQESIALFARPSISRDASTEEDDNDKSRSTVGNDVKKFSIHDSGKDGEQSVFEVSIVCVYFWPHVYSSTSR